MPCQPPLHSGKKQPCQCGYIPFECLNHASFTFALISDLKDAETENRDFYPLFNFMVCIYVAPSNRRETQEKRRQVILRWLYKEALSPLQNQPAKNECWKISVRLI